MKVLHVITGLKDGGAENTLFKICKHDSFNKHVVISLTGPGKYYSLLKKLNIKVYYFNMKFYSIIKFYNLIRFINLSSPDVVQTWLPLGDFVGGLASRLAGINAVVWNIRGSNLTGVVKLRTILLIKFLSKLSHIIPKFIIVNSNNGLKYYKDLKYCSKKLKLIHNGYDLSLFKPNIRDNNIAKKFEIKKNTFIIGSVARYDPTKDHTNLLNSLSLVKKKNLKFLCILVGSNIKNEKIIQKVKDLKLDDCVKLVGESKNILKYFRLLDIHILSSKTEGFPNVVAEAMACGTPCIVTDVGDAALIVGKNGWVVPPENSKKLADAIEKGLKEVKKKSWNKRCYQARLIIKNNFELMDMIYIYNKIWSKVLITKQ